jgi:hypothetical protein
MSILGWFSKDIVEDHVHHNHYDSVITLLSRFLESGVEIFTDENLKSIFERIALLKLVERWLFVQFISAVCLGIGYVSSVSVFGNQGLIILM